VFTSQRVGHDENAAMEREMNGKAGEKVKIAEESINMC